MKEGVFFAHNPALKMLIVVILGAATLVLNLDAGAEPLTGQNQNTALTSLEHDESIKPQRETGLDQDETVLGPRHAGMAPMHDDEPCTVMCLLPGIASDKD